MIKISSAKEFEEVPPGAVVMTPDFLVYLRIESGYARRIAEHGWDYDDILKPSTMYLRHYTMYIVYSVAEVHGRTLWMTSNPDSCFDPSHEDNDDLISAEDANDHCSHEEDSECFNGEHIDAGDAYEYCGHSENGDCFNGDHIHPDDAHDYCGHSDEECSHNVYVTPDVDPKGEPVGAVQIDGYKLCEEWELSRPILARLGEILA